MTAQETSVANFFSTELSSGVTNSTLTFPVDSIGSLTSPCLIIIDPDNAVKREIVRCDGTWGGASFVASALGRRGLSGSASGAQAHDAGTVVEVRPLAQHIQDIHDRVDVNETDIATNTADVATNASAIATNTTHRGLTTAHSAVSTATADRMVVRDASARARFADPVTAQDAATKVYVDTEVSDHDAVVQPHGAVTPATANTLVFRDANARARVADPATALDIANKQYVDGEIDAKFTQTMTEFTATLASSAGDMTKWNGTGATKRGAWASANKIANVWMKFVYGSTGAVGTGNLYANLPVNASTLDALTVSTSPGGGVTIGTWHMRTAAGVTDLGTVQLRTAGTVFFLRPASGQLLDTADMTATGDALHMQLTYPIA